MHRVLLAERAVLIQLQSFRIVLLILHRIIISVFAFGAFECNFCSVYGSHFLKTPCKKITPSAGVCFKVYHNIFTLSTIFYIHFLIFRVSDRRFYKNPRRFRFFCALSRKFLAYPCLFGV